MARDDEVPVAFINRCLFEGRMRCRYGDDKVPFQGAMRLIECLFEGRWGAFSRGDRVPLEKDLGVGLVSVPGR